MVRFFSLMSVLNRLSRILHCVCRRPWASLGRYNAIANICVSFGILHLTPMFIGLSDESGKLGCSGDAGSRRVPESLPAIPNADRASVLLQTCIMSSLTTTSKIETTSGRRMLLLQSLGRLEPIDSLDVGTPHDHAKRKCLPGERVASTNISDGN